MSKLEAFAALHAAEPFVIPNPWDAGSALALEQLGFRALATTSSGFAFTLGRPDGGATLDEVVAHVAALDAATSLPVSVDLEDGKGDPATAIRRVAEAGAAGGSIEDWHRSGGLYELTEAVERVAAAVAAAPPGFVVTARAENHIRGNPDLGDTIARLQAFEQAGAQCLFAPGLQTIDEVRAICTAVSKPVNVLVRPHFTFAELVDAGVQRVSVGGGLTWVAANAALEVARTIRERGDFSGLVARSPLA